MIRKYCHTKQDYHDAKARHRHTISSHTSYKIVVQKHDPTSDNSKPDTITFINLTRVKFSDILINR